MTCTRDGAGRRAAVILGLALMLTPLSVRASGASDLFYERAVMSGADARCRLFTPDIAAALNAGKAQARGAALRAGADNAFLLKLAAQAKATADSVPCASADLAKAAARVRSGFDGYSRLLRLNLPGDASSWRADRATSATGPTWRLSQTTLIGGAPLTFGLFGRRGEAPQLAAVTDFGDGAQPYAARLLVRDQARAPEAYLDVIRVSATARIPLEARTPPVAAARVYQAEARDPADPHLLGPGQTSATAFRFPSAAVDAIAGLDPREAVTVEFLFAGRSGDTVRRAFVEVGDFAAGQAFLTVAKR